MLRVFRVLRILRLLKGAKGVRDLLMTLVLSFPALVNVFGLLALCMFIYSILGVQLFTFVMRGDNLTDDRNFDTFGQAALLLFQVITGDGWSGLMEDCMVDQARGCDPAEGNCGSGCTAFLSDLPSHRHLRGDQPHHRGCPRELHHARLQDPNMITATTSTCSRKCGPSSTPTRTEWCPSSTCRRSSRVPAAWPRRRRPAEVRAILHESEISPNGEVKFKDMLDALVNKNFAEHGEELPTDAAAAAKVIEERKRSISRGESLGRGKALAAGSAPLSARQKAMAQRFAEQLLTKFIRRKRAQSADGKLKIGKSPTREGRAPKSNVSTVPALRARLRAGRQRRWPRPHNAPRPRRGARLRSLRAHPHWRAAGGNRAASVGGGQVAGHQGLRQVARLRDGKVRKTWDLAGLSHRPVGSPFLREAPPATKASLEWSPEICDALPPCVHGLTVADAGWRCDDGARSRGNCDDAAARAHGGAEKQTAREAA